MGITRRSLLSAAASPLVAKARDITGFGAVPDGKQNSRAAIQRAIDECAAQGGGLVRIPTGRFISGSIRLKSGVALWLDHGAVLTASNDPAQYEARRPTNRVPRDSFACAFILGEGIERVAILGSGTITGAGLAKPTTEGKPLEPFRPRLISFEHCRDIRVEDLTLRDPDRWTLHFYDCEGVQVRSLRIRAGYRIGNSDGIDVDGSRNVIVSGCDIVTGDDCIVLKTSNYLGEPCPCENVTVTNCTLSTRSAGLKIGTETHANFSNIAFSNCAIFGNGAFRPDGVCLEAVDGALVRGVTVSNISMRHVSAPVFVRVAARAAASRLEDAVITNIVAVDAATTSSITGIPSQAVANVSVSDARMVMTGGGDASLSGIDVPEKEAAYPKGRMWGQLPAYGLFLRHARGLALRNIDISCEEPDARPSMIADDVEGVVVDGMRAAGPLRLNSVRRAVLRGSWTRVVVSGRQSDRILLESEQAAPSAIVLECAPDVPPQSVRLSGGKEMK